MVIILAYLIRCNSYFLSYLLFRNRSCSASSTLSISLAVYLQAFGELIHIRSQFQRIVVVDPLLGDLQGDGFVFGIAVTEGRSWR